MSSSDLEPPRGANNKKKVWIAIVSAIATQTLGTRTYPKRFQLHGPNGQVLEGAVTVGSVDDKVVEQLVESVLPLPPQYVNRQGVPGDFQLPVDAFNCVVTFAEEREDGTLVPQVSA